MREGRVFGSPGTGKTTRLVERIGGAAQLFGPEAIMACSFTRTAATELLSKLRESGVEMPSDRGGTLHSVCHRAIDKPKIVETKAMLKEWNKSLNGPHIIYALSESDGPDIEEWSGEVNFGTEGDRLFARMQTLRARMVPVEQWPESVGGLWRRWNDWKAEVGGIDFTDMVEMAYRDVDEAPGHPSVGFFDEVQDFTSLELGLVRKWAERMEYIILAGDDDQASLEGTPVLTTDHGWVPVEQLDPVRNRLVSYDFRGAEMNGLRKGHRFEIRSHHHDGDVLTVSAGGHSTRCTPEHFWWVRWTPEIIERNPTIVYLMRKGNWWRVGWCQMFRTDGVFHLGARAHLDGADAAWILRVCDSRAEASQWESIIAARYGLPLVVWRPIHDQSRGHYTSDVVNNIYTSLEDVMSERASRCLLDHHLLETAPFWQPRSQSRFGARIHRIKAVNLIPSLMQVPVYGGNGKDDVAWHPIEREYGEYSGLVYSLAVEPHRNYIVDGGIATGNCLYLFKGSTPDAFLNPPIPDRDKEILPISHRVPRAVHVVADRLVRTLTRREPKVWSPRAFEGSVRRLEAGTFKVPERIVADAMARLEEKNDRGEPKTVMILTSCSFMLDPIKAMLRKEGIPFANPWRRRRGDWNPLARGRGVSTADRVLAFLRPQLAVWGEQSRMWTPEDLRRWFDLVKADVVLRKGLKAQVDKMEGDDPIEDILLLMTWLQGESYERAMEGDLGWLQRVALPSKAGTLEYPLTIARRRGARTLMDMPRLFIGTIHSVKGAEADVVYVCPDVSQAGAREWQRVGEGRDSVIRQMYVAFTRAREELVLCGQATPFAVPWSAAA